MRERELLCFTFVEQTLVARIHFFSPSPLSFFIPRSGIILRERCSFSFFFFFTTWTRFSIFQEKGAPRIETRPGFCCIYSPWMRTTGNDIPERVIVSRGPFKYALLFIQKRSARAIKNWECCKLKSYFEGIFIIRISLRDPT